MSDDVTLQNLIDTINQDPQQVREALELLKKSITDVNLIDTIDDADSWIVRDASEGLDRRATAAKILQQVVRSDSFKSLEYGLISNRPTASEAGEDAFYLSTDEPMLYRSDGADWEVVLSTSIDTLADLQAADTNGARSVYMLGRTSAGDGGEGHFTWDSSDLSTEVGNDEVTAGEGDGGIYVAPDSDKTGANGAWVRQYSGALNVRWWGASDDGVTDAGPAFNLAVAASRNGDVIVAPSPDTAYQIDTLVTVDKTVHVVGSGMARGCKITSSGNVFSITDEGASVSGFFLEGDRSVTGHTAVEVAAPKVTVRDLRVELFNIGVHQSANNFHARYENIRCRNIVDTAYWFEDGVGPRLVDLLYDTDTGTYAEPTTGGIVVNCEGVQAVNCDIIRGYIGLRIYPTSSRSVEWCLFSNCFFDTCEASGISIENDQTSNYVRGVWFNQVWSATAGGIGTIITGSGSGDIDGIYFNGCPMHNNDDEGIRIEYSSAKNIILNSCDLVGNAKSGTASNLYSNITGPVRINGCSLKQAAQWSSTPERHIYLDTGQGDTYIADNELDRNVSVGQILDSSAGLTSFGRNVNLVTKNNGAATVPNGGNSVSVNHGLDVTPSKRHVQLTPQTGWGGGGEFWIETIDATSIGIRTLNNVGNDVPMSWAIEVLEQ